MLSGYEYIKLIYERVWMSLDYKPVDIQEIDFKEFVSSMYDDLVKTKYQGHEKFALHHLKMTSAKLKELILDTMFSNLFCDFLLMLQNLEQSKHRIKHEFFLTSNLFNNGLDTERSETRKERFRRRMQADRLNRIKKFKINSKDKVVFYGPTLIRAFKETLLIPRPNTEIFDIAKNYADIFFALMFVLDDEDVYVETKKSREVIKAYRLWELTEDELYLVLYIFERVINNEKNGNQFAQLMLLEKMYGIYNIADLLELKVKDCFIDYSFGFFYAFSNMRRFGYCLLHQQLVGAMSDGIIGAIDMKDVIDRFIYPVCLSIYKKTLKTVLKALEDCDTQQRIRIVTHLLEVCRENREIVFSREINKILGKYREKLLVDLIKAMNMINVITDEKLNFFVKLIGVVNLDVAEGMKKYLKIFSNKSYVKQWYNEKYKNIDFKSLYEVSFYDLTITDKYTVTKQDLNKIFNPNSKYNK